MARKYYYVFEANDVDEWKLCPNCGAEILWIYLGDFTGHIACDGECSAHDDVTFEIQWEEEDE